MGLIMFPRGGEFHHLQLDRGSRQTEKGENCLYESRNKTLEETLPSEEGGEIKKTDAYGEMGEKSEDGEGTE